MKSDSLVIEYHVNNLRETYARASLADQIIGEEWYTLAKEECRKISRETSFPLKRVIWAMAALSNNKTWEKNVDLTRSVCFALRHNKDAKGHFYALIDKATRILVDGEFSALSGPKVIPFAQAMYQPKSDAAVVDRWIWRAAYRAVDVMPTKLTPARLRRVSVALRRVARELDLPVTTVQATIWTVIRRENSILPLEG